MKDETIRDQNRLVELIQDEGWRVTALELNQYDAAPGSDDDVMGAEIKLTVDIDYTTDKGGDNPYRLK